MGVKGVGGSEHVQGNSAVVDGYNYCYKYPHSTHTHSTHRAAWSPHINSITKTHSVHTVDYHHLHTKCTQGWRYYRQWTHHQDVQQSINKWHIPSLLFEGIRLSGQSQWRSRAQLHEGLHRYTQVTQPASMPTKDSHIVVVLLLHQPLNNLVGYTLRGGR